jgi:hypothetical protein
VSKRRSAVRRREQPEAYPKPDSLRYERQKPPKDFLVTGIAWFGVIILMAMIWIVLDV